MSPALRMAFYAGLYALADGVGYVRGLHPAFHTIWLPSGIAVAALLICGYRCLPLLFATHLGIAAATVGIGPMMLSSAAVAAAQSALAFELLRRAQFHPALRTERDALVLLIAGGLVPCLLCSGLAFELYRLTGRPIAHPLLPFCLLWTMRGAAGVMATAPIVLAFSPSHRPPRLPVRRTEFVVVTALTTATALTLFSSPGLFGLRGYPQSFLPYPFLVWAALRLDLRGVSVCTSIVTICAAQATASGRGPFAAGQDVPSILLVWVYVCVSSVTTMLLCLSREERRDLEERVIQAGERERIRLGTELHDDLCQRLASVGFVSGILRNRPGLVSPEAIPYVDHVCQEIQGCIQNMRHLARGLSPLGIATRNLAAALADLAALSEAVYGVECRYEADEPLPELDPDVATHLLRIAQEAVGNAVKHGKAGHLVIAVSSGSGRLIMSITDDGSGLPDVLAESEGLGFKTMAYRTDLMRGSFSIENRIGRRGTRVVCSIPMPPVHLEAISPRRRASNVA